MDSLKIVLRTSKLKNSFMIVGKKNITIREDIYIKLVKLGGHGESMDDIIKKLLDFYERHRKWALIVFLIT